ncbi:hypothetical protein EON81_00085 [bacterium]|nr:MAG: hypothetical protein EON81_00085 [bacterium]
MRSIATIALSLFFGLGFSQSPTYSRITLDPTVTVPAGDAVCLDIAPIGGYSLVLSNAGNIARDTGFESQYYLVSPRGEAERIPLEKVGEMARPIAGLSYLQDQAKISPRGSAAVVRGRYSDSNYYFYRREGKQIQRIPGPLNWITGFQAVVGFISETAVLLAREAGPATSDPNNPPTWAELVKYDCLTGLVTPVELPGSSSYFDYRSLLGGRKIVYSSTEDNRLHLYDIKTGVDTPTPIESFGPNQKFDQTGTYLYRTRNESDGVVLERVVLATGKVESLFKQEGFGAETLILEAAFGDKALFMTSGGIDDRDPKVIGWDAYQFDVSTGQLALVSVKPDGTASNNLPPYTGTNFFTPDGSAVVYQAGFESQIPPPPGPVPGEWLYAFRHSYRQSVGQPRELVVQTIGGGGANYRTGVSSRNGTAVIYAASDAGNTTFDRLVVRDSSARVNGRVVPTANPNRKTPLDVSDDGRFAVYRATTSTGVNDGIHLFVQDAQTGLTKWVTNAFTNGAISHQGKVDQDGKLYFTAFATDRYPGLTGNWLFRYDIQTETLTPLKETGISFYGEMEVGGGRVAYIDGPNGAPVVVVVDGVTGEERMRTAAPTGFEPTLMSLTTDRKTIALSTRTSTLLYDIPTGSLRQTVPTSGKLTPSGEWVTGYSEVCYVPTGAVFSHSPETAALGAPVGPLALWSYLGGGNPIAPNNDRGMDLLRYRISIPTSPVLYTTLFTTEGGNFSIFTKMSVAGLQKAESWVEARIDGGDWQRLTMDQIGYRISLPRPARATAVEVRGRDALGRTSEIQSFAFESDTVAPLVEGVTATVSGTEVTVGFTMNEAGSSQVRYGVDTLTDRKVFEKRAAGARQIKLSGLKPNTTYKYRVEVSDRAGNIGRSEELTFTTGS